MGCDAAALPLSSANSSSSIATISYFRAEAVRRCSRGEPQAARAMAMAITSMNLAVLRGSTTACSSSSSSAVGPFRTAAMRGRSGVRRGALCALAEHADDNPRSRSPVAPRYRPRPALPTLPPRLAGHWGIRRKLVAELGGAAGQPRWARSGSCGSVWGFGAVSGGGAHARGPRRRRHPCLLGKRAMRRQAGGLLARRRTICATIIQTMQPSTGPRFPSWVANASSRRPRIAGGRGDVSG